MAGWYALPAFHSAVSWPFLPFPQLHFCLSCLSFGCILALSAVPWAVSWSLAECVETPNLDVDLLPFLLLLGLYPGIWPNVVKH